MQDIMWPFTFSGDAGLLFGFPVAAHCKSSQVGVFFFSIDIAWFLLCCSTVPLVCRGSFSCLFFWLCMLLSVCIFIVCELCFILLLCYCVRKIGVVSWWWHIYYICSGLRFVDRRWKVVYLQYDRPEVGNELLLLKKCVRAPSNC